MKKFSQISLIVALVLALHVQSVDAKQRTEQTIKLNHSTIDDQVSNNFQSVDIGLINLQSVEGSGIELESQNKNECTFESNINQEEHMRVFLSELTISDDEEDINVENWMLDPCEWLCN